MGENQESVGRGGRRWFMLMGPLAIFLTIWLFNMDRYLTENDGEIVKGEVLRRLRTAQSGMDTVHYDNRQGGYDASSAGLYLKMKSADSASSASATASIETGSHDGRADHSVSDEEHRD